MAPVWQIVGTLYERQALSPVMSEFAAQLDEQVTTMLTNGLSSLVDDGELPTAVDTVRATIEGTYFRHLDRPRRHAILRFLLQRISTPNRPDY